MKTTLSSIMDIGEQMLLFGAEVHRVEESISRMGHALGAARVDVFITTSFMMTTIYDKDGNFWTQTRRISSIDTDFEKIHQLNALSRQICEKKLTLEQIPAALEQAMHTKNYSFWVECLAYSIIAGSFTMFFGGGATEAAVSLVVGALTRLVILFAEKAVANKIFSKFFSSLIATILAYVAHHIGWIDMVDTVIIGNIMTLIPGVGLTNAFRDLFTGDSISGILRTIEAVLTALAIAAGYFLVTLFGGTVL